MPKGMILEHIGMVVKNRDESLEFYTKVMGFKLLRKYETDKQRVAYLYLNDQLLELNELFSKDRPLGLSHLGFRVEDMNEAMDELKKHGVELIDGPIKFQPEIYATAKVTEEKLLRALKPTEKPYWLISMFRDSNGVTIELLER
ncbi:MAG: VOC family protein [Candidatus Bathyarchaeota archaeon]|nr:VOC family protein [Candidatus Bathyarchaeota archaeon]